MIMNVRKGAYVLCERRRLRSVCVSARSIQNLPTATIHYIEWFLTRPSQLDWVNTQDHLCLCSPPRICDKCHLLVLKLKFIYKITASLELSDHWAIKYPDKWSNTVNITMSYVSMSSKKTFIEYAKSNGPGQPAHMRRLIWAIAFRQYWL